MSASCHAFSRCAERHRARGAAVVLALLTVSFAAIVASAALADFGHSLEEVSGRNDQAHARQLALAGIDWARNVLADDARSSPVDHRGEPWAIRIPPTPIAEDASEGTIGGVIEDLSGRFNLNDLAPAANGDDAIAARERFAALLNHAGVASGRATTSAEALARHLAAQAPRTLADITELGRIPGFDAALIERIEPLVTAVPGPARVNLNTAPAEVLAALIDGLGVDAARAITAARERDWFRNTGDLSVRLPQGATVPPARLADVNSRYFLITIHARHGVAVTELQALVDRQQPWPEILWYRSP